MSKSLKEAIQFGSTETAPCAYKLEFKIGKEAVDTVFGDALKAAQKHAQLPGFRQGKAPLAMVKNRYAQYIGEDAERQIQSAAFEKLSEDEKMDVVSFGAMNAEKKPEAGADYTFTLDVELAPEFVLPVFEKISVKPEEGDSVEKRVEGRLEYMKNLYADYVTLEEPAQKGDMLKVSYESDFALPEDAPATLARSVKSDESWIWLNEPEQIPGALKALEGAVKGGEYNFAAVFPADWREAALASKTVNYKVKVHEVQRKIAIENNDKLAEKVGAPNAEEMMKNLRESAERECEYAKKEQIKGKLLEQILIKTAEFPLPKAVLNSTVEREFSRIAERLVRSEKDVEAFKADKEKHLEDAKKAAEAYLRKFFILRKVARLEKITVSNEELDAQIKGMSSYMGYKEADIRKMLDRNGGGAEMQAEMLMNKALDFLTGKIKVD